MQQTAQNRHPATDADQRQPIHNLLSSIDRSHLEPRSDRCPLRSPRLLLFTPICSPLSFSAAVYQTGQPRRPARRSSECKSAPATPPFRPPLGIHDPLTEFSTTGVLHPPALPAPPPDPRPAALPLPTDPISQPPNTTPQPQPVQPPKHHDKFAPPQRHHRLHPPPAQLPARLVWTRAPDPTAATSAPQSAALGRAEGDG